ncbi:MAG: acyl-CoA reductase [Spirosomataceae bacterium]
MDTITKRIRSFAELGKLLQTSAVDEVIQRAYSQNHWFTPDFSRRALEAISEEYLKEEKLTEWTQQYTLPHSDPAFSPKKIGVVMAGNVPAVGFQDLLCVLISGHHLIAKISTDDRVLMAFFIDQLTEIDPEWKERITIAERLNAADAYIATGSDNTARYFEYYFSKKPNIIRRNRTSVGILNGNETPEDLAALGQDILQYFGLGCRNVAKLFVPKGYDFTAFYETIAPLHPYYVNHHKYFNNYEYNKSVYLVNREPHLDNGFLMLRQTDALVSPISVLFYETYSSQAELNEQLADREDKIQCIVSQKGNYPNSLPFGQAQTPTLFDYADGVDTMAFLSNL